MVETCAQKLLVWPAVEVYAERLYYCGMGWKQPICGGRRLNRWCCPLSCGSVWSLAKRTNNRNGEDSAATVNTVREQYTFSLASVLLRSEKEKLRTSVRANSDLKIFQHFLNIDTSSSNLSHRIYGHFWRKYLYYSHSSSYVTNFNASEAYACGAIPKNIIKIISDTFNIKSCYVG